ncbi:MAG: aminotransferase class V-fold PLP-dependent enzyme [Planctomycetes bacterium]|nr:aminotransferase class V-fold PLP-dependent enzyme [Planctomycetota bacterium]
MNRAPSADLAAHWGLDPEVTFLNHGSFGACPTTVLDYQGELRARLEREPVRFMARELEGLLDAARAMLAAFLGARPEDVVFVNNATSAVNAVLRHLPLETGDELLVSDQEYNACRNVVDFVARRADASVKVVRLPFPVSAPDEIVDAFAAAVGPRTRLALFDHVTSQTGLVFPAASIAAALRERGVRVLIDGAHAPGMLPLELESIGADYYTGNLHKWVCAPKGAAFLWVRRELQPEVRPAVISHGANADDSQRSRFQLEFGWTGTDDPTAWLCVPEALRFLGTLLPGGWPELMRRNRALALRGRDILAEALATAPPAPAEMIGSLAALPLPDGGEEPRSYLYVDPLQTALYRDHRIEVPVIPWPAPPKRLIRISAQLYNTEQDYHLLAQALRRMFPR